MKLNEKNILRTKSCYLWFSIFLIYFHSDDFAQNSVEVELNLFSKKDQLISNKIKNLLKRSVLKDEKGKFIPSIFLVPKTENEFRMILNFKRF